MIIRSVLPDLLLGGRRIARLGLCAAVELRLTGLVGAVTLAFNH